MSESERWLMKIYGVQMDIKWEDKEANHRKVEELLNGARPLRGSLVVLPEMFATGFSMNVGGIAEDEGGRTHQFCRTIAGRYGVYLMAGVVTSNCEGRGRNQAVVFGPGGEEVVRYQKMQPFTPGGESRHYEAGTNAAQFEWGGAGGVKVSPFVCYDLRFPEVFRAAVGQGAELMCVIASWPAARVHHWRMLLTARAIENQAYVVGVNRVGRDPTLAYPGRSMIVDPKGQVVADGGDQECVISADIDGEMLRSYRESLPFLADMRGDR